MRALRDSLISFADRSCDSRCGASRAASRGGLAISLAFLTGLLACGLHADEADESAAPAKRPAAQSYLPLAVGNEWAYRCSVEGEYQNDKTVKLVSSTEKDGIVFFTAQMQTGDSDGPLEYFLYADSKRDVYRSFAPSRKESELQVTAGLKKGEKVGALRVSGREKLTTSGLGTLEVVRVESFDLDDPALSEDQQLDWEGRFYARGIGLVSEADGLGGECEISRHRILPQED